MVPMPPLLALLLGANLPTATCLTELEVCRCWGRQGIRHALLEAALDVAVVELYLDGGVLVGILEELLGLV